MVQVVPPEGWTGEKSPAEEPAEQVAASAAAVAAAATPAAAETTRPAEPPVSDAADAEVAETAEAAAVEEASGGGTISAAAEAETLAPSGAWASPAELVWRKWLLFAAGSVAGAVVIVGICTVLFPPGKSQPTPVPTVEQPGDPTAERPTPAVERPEPSRDRLDPRWLPAETTLVLSFRPRQLASQPESSNLIGQIDSLWQPTVGTVLGGLGLKLQGIVRLTWASTDLAAWPQRSVVVIELEEGRDAKALESAGQTTELVVDGTACRRLPNGPWTHPFAIIDRRTIVTGDAELLGRLPRQAAAPLQIATLRRLLKVTARDADVTLLIDLSAARAADWQLPAALLDVWRAGRQPWHVLCEMPEGLGCVLRWSDPMQSELALVCEGDTAAKKVAAALDELVPAGGEAISGQLESLPAKLGAGEITAATALQYELLLKQGLAATKAARWEVADGTVFVRVDWDGGPAALAAATVGSRPAIRAGWLAAAAEVDRSNYGRLLGGLNGYRKAMGRFPPAAAGSALLSPETRLSWIAQTLPYFGYPGWHRRLEFGYPWNGPQNRETTRQSLPEVVNPALGPGRTEAGFFVTHYVGVAGFGPDAARLNADDPRAGVFGYGRTTRPEDIADGASNTIAILGVTERLGPWAAGGDSTVRALTTRPYVNGPDGFGSGRPGGMFAGMADGSVRFVSQDVDPLVLEQLATMGGREKATAVALSPPPDLPQPKPDGPKPEPDRPRAPDPSPDRPPAGIHQKPALPPVDVKTQLAQTIPQIELTDMPLAEAVGLLSAMSTVPVTFDPEALAQKGVSLRDPVTVKLSEGTLEEILQMVVSSRGLATVVTNGHVLITSPVEHRQMLRQRQYTVSDLTGTDPAAIGELAALVQKLVVPDSWRKSGGRGTAVPHGNTLLVVQTAAVHDHVLVFCEKLRNARGKPLKSRQDPTRFALATRRDLASRVLQLPVSVNFHQPTPLIEILAYLGQLTETDVLVDRLALDAAGLSEKTDATLKVQEQPLAVALDELLGPLGLNYRAIDVQTLQVTTQKAVAAGLELEFYPVGELLEKPPDGGRTGPQLIEWIKGRVAGSTWSDAGGPAVLHFDRPSKCLIVLQSQPVQAALGRLLAEAAGPNAPAPRVP